MGEGMNELQPIKEMLPISIGSDVGAIAVAQRQASVLQEIQGAIFLAKQFPRNEKQCWSDLMSSVQRKTLAEAATYSYKRGGSQIKGPSVKLARAAAYAWRNIRWGTEIVGDDGELLTAESWAWDIERNIKKIVQDRFSKLVQRKSTNEETGEQVTKWVKPDERDLRELMNRRAAIAERNCLLQILPSDMIDDAMDCARKTVESGIKDAAGESKSLILQFRKLGVSAEQINAYLGTDTWGATDIADLKEILTSIKDGNSSREEYFTAEGKKDMSAKTKSIADDLAKKAQVIKGQGTEGGSLREPTPEQIERGELFPE